jgi:hypothetical protein
MQHSLWFTFIGLGALSIACKTREFKPSVANSSSDESSERNEAYEYDEDCGRALAEIYKQELKKQNLAAEKRINRDTEITLKDAPETKLQGDAKPIYAALKEAQGRFRKPKKFPDDLEENTEAFIAWANKNPDDALSLFGIRSVKPDTQYFLAPQLACTDRVSGPVLPKGDLEIVKEKNSGFNLRAGYCRGDDLTPHPNHLWIYEPVKKKDSKSACSTDE